MKANRLFHVVATMGLLAVNSGAAEPQLTIYNQNFAVVRMMIPLDLNAGMNRIQFTDLTAYLEPEPQLTENPLALPNPPMNLEIFGQVMRQQFPIPKILTVSQVSRVLSKLTIDIIPLVFTQQGRPPGMKCL
jgi:hypothetical protein